MRITNLPVLAILLSMLTACSGDGISDISESSVGGEVDDNTGNVTDAFDDGSISTVSYLPLVTIEKYQDWSGFNEDEQFRTYWRSPFVKHYVINPVNATTLAPVSNATINDFVITEDDVPLNPAVNFPMLQKIVGNPLYVTTALVINTSGTMDAVTKTAFIQEIKDFVTAAKASSVTAINSQAMTVWAFDGSAVTGDGGIVEETGGYKTAEADIHAALDTVLTNWTNDSYAVSGSNHQYDAIVEAIGRFEGDGPFSTTLSYSDALNASSNDLFEWITPDYMLVTNVVLFSAGTSSTNHFDAEYAIKALQNQALITYNPNSEGAGVQSETVTIGKPLIYVVPDGEETDAVLENYAYSTIKNTISGGEYSFASAILSAQQTAVNERLYTENQHVVRFASSFRQGTNYQTVFSTKTSENSYGYALTTSYSDDRMSTLPMPEPSVEITGANDEYLPADIGNSGAEYTSAIAFYDQIQTFYPATRWTNTEYESSDYSWASSGQINANADGSVTVDTGNTFPLTITLTNNVISDSFTVTVYESY